MMGSRGEPPPAVAALRMQYELLELVKSADLPAHIAQLREAENAARAAIGELDKKTAELDARHKDLVELATAGEIREKQTAEREAACAAREEETARQQASFDAQNSALDTQKQEVADRISRLLAEANALEAAKLLHAGEHQAKALALTEDSIRERRESEAAIQVMRAKAEDDIAALRAKTQADITAAQETLQAREDKIAARQEEFEAERARFSALLHK